MTIKHRPLPYAIATMMLLAGVKTAGLVHAIGVGSPALAASTARQDQPAKPDKPVPKPGAAEQASCEQAPAEPPISETERATLQDLRARRKELEARAAKLDERDAILAAAERRLTERVDQMAALQTKLEQLEKERHSREDENWKGLVKTYEAMRPRDAGAIFNDLDSTVLIQVLDRMKEAKAAPILAAMAPDRARAATTQLAQWRNQASAAPNLDGAGSKP